jgi:3-hydroxybutyryl-CoA dehydrogenase
MAVRKVGVVGCGQMGAGIAQIVAEAGYPVLAYEISRELLERGLARVEKAWTQAVTRGKLTSEAHSRAAAHLRGTLQLEELADCSLVIEAIVEDAAAKQDVFRNLDACCRPETILASNTSSLIVLDLAVATARPDRVCGLHFFNPVPVMRLVEVVRTVQTSDATFETVYDFARSLGKEPITARDSSGFIVNRLLVPYLLDAIRAVEAGVASIGDIDTGMRLGCGHPMGPLLLLDFIGLDTIQFIAETLYQEFHEPRYAPPPLLKRLVRAGFCGKKTGRGFYDHSGSEPKVAPLNL